MDSLPDEMLLRVFSTLGSLDEIDSREWYERLPFPACVEVPGRREAPEQCLRAYPFLAQARPWRAPGCLATVYCFAF